MWDIDVFHDSTHVTAQERAGLELIKAAGLTEIGTAASEVRPRVHVLGLPAVGVPRRNAGCTIDLVYATDPSPPASPTPSQRSRGARRAGRRRPCAGRGGSGRLITMP